MTEGRMVIYVYGICMQRNTNYALYTDFFLLHIDKYSNFED